MENGRYKVSFNVNLNSCEDEAEAFESVRDMVENMIANHDFPEVVFELVEETDLEYSIEEDDLQELNF